MAKGESRGRDREQTAGHRDAAVAASGDRGWAQQQRTLRGDAREGERYKAQMRDVVAKGGWMDTQSKGDRCQANRMPFAKFPKF